MLKGYLWTLFKSLCDNGKQAIDNLPQIVRWTFGSHGHRNAFRAIDQKIGYLRRETYRLIDSSIKIRRKINGVLINICNDLLGNLGHTRFGISVCGGRVSIHRTKIALSFDKKLSHIP